MCVILRICVFFLYFFTLKISGAAFSNYIRPRAHSLLAAANIEDKRDVKSLASESEWLFEKVVIKLGFLKETALMSVSVLSFPPELRLNQPTQTLVLFNARVRQT